LKFVYFSPSTDPYFNLALEEYLIRNKDWSEDALLLIYQNEPSIILGKNQNFLTEVNQQFWYQNEYKVCRRISGGGTVVHDLGNINFSFFESKTFEKVNSYKSSVLEILRCIDHLSIACEVNSRNAIFLKDELLKISGSAQFTSINSILSHLTLLFESNTKIISEILEPNPFKIETKASPSVRSKIGNLKPYTNFNIEDFKMYCANFLEFNSEFSICQEDILKTKALSKIYASNSWIYEKAGTCKFEGKLGKIHIENGIITHFEYENIDPHFYIGKMYYEPKVLKEITILNWK
jgi:lipoate-protein ligase A